MTFSSSLLLQRFLISSTAVDIQPASKGEVVLSLSLLDRATARADHIFIEACTVKQDWRATEVLRT